MTNLLAVGTTSGEVELSPLKEHLYNRIGGS